MSCLLVLLLTGCTYQVAVQPASATAEYTSYTDKVPGKFALYIDAAQMSTSAEQLTQGCPLSKFPINASEAFRTSTVQTFQKIVQTVDVVDAPLPKEELIQKGYRGLISVRADSFIVHMAVIPGFWTATIEGDASLSVGVLVDGPTDRLFDASVSSERSSEKWTIGDCGVAVDAISVATTAAVKDAMEQLAGRVNDAPKLRQTTTTGSSS